MQLDDALTTSGRGEKRSREQEPQRGSIALSTLFHELLVKAAEVDDDDDGDVDTWLVQHEEWLTQVGTALLDAIQEVSQRGFVLANTEPQNFMCSGETIGSSTRDPSASRPTPILKDAMSNPLVIRAINLNDPLNVAQVSLVESKDFECVEVLNLLLFLNVMQCEYGNVENGGAIQAVRDDLASRGSELLISEIQFINKIVMEPLRARLRELGDIIEYSVDEAGRGGFRGIASEV